MHELPATPITDAPAPAWTGYPLTSDRHGGWIKVPPEPLPPGVKPVFLQPPLITGEQLKLHLQRPDSWRSLPDGRPLRLCVDALEYMGEDGFGGYDPGSLRSAIRVLWFATRTPEQMDALWVPPPLPPVEGAEGVLRTAEQPVGLAFRLRELQAEISRWGRETFAPCAHMGVRHLALDLWINVVDRIPVPAEKKSPEPEAATESPAECDKATSGKCAGTSPADAPSATASCATQISSPSAMPSSAGLPSTSTGTASSPVPKSSSDSPLPDG